MKKIKIILDNNEYTFDTKEIGILHKCQRTMTESLINKKPFVFNTNDLYAIFSYEYLSSVKVIIIKEN
jgi:hypothetical protein